MVIPVMVTNLIVEEHNSAMLSWITLVCSELIPTYDYFMLHAVNFNRKFGNKSLKMKGHHRVPLTLNASLSRPRRENFTLQLFL